MKKKKKVIKYYKSALGVLLVLSLFFVIGCPERFSIEFRALDHLADVLAQWPDQWEGALTDTIDELEESGTNLAVEIAADLKQLYEESFLMATSQTLFCGHDFVGDRARERVEAIRHNYWPKQYPAPVRTPQMCLTSPEYIDNDTVKAIFSGYNLINFSVVIEYADGEVVLDNPPLIASTEYEIGVDLNAVNLSSLNLDESRSPRLSLKWEGGESEILIVLEEEPVITIPQPFPRNYMKPGEYLKTGEYIVNSNKTMFATMQADGNFVIYRGQGPHLNFGAVWSTQTSGINLPCFAVMQWDGNFVIYRGFDPDHAYGAVWSTQTAIGFGNYFATMQNDGNFVIYQGVQPNPSQVALWQSGTNVY